MRSKTDSIRLYVKKKKIRAKNAFISRLKVFAREEIYCLGREKYYRNMNFGFERN